MKKIILIIIIFLTVTLYAQVPEKMSYQAIIRDAGDVIVSNQNIGMQVSILQGSTNGTAVYVETHTPTSNINGLINLDIGVGAIVTGSFNSIDWANGPYFIKTETDITGGTNYTITGTSQLQSVPYALFARSSGSTNSVNLSKCNCNSYVIPYIPYGANFGQIISVSNTPSNWNGNTGVGTATDVFAEAIDNDGNSYDLGLLVNVASGTVANIQSLLSQKLTDEGFDGSGNLAIRFTMSNPENVYMSASYRALSANDRVFLEINCVR